MKRYKLISCVAVFAMVALLCESASFSRFHIGRLWNSGQTAGLNRSLTEVETAVTANGVGVSGSFAIVSDLTVGGIITDTPTSLDVTNSAVLTATNSVYILNGTGGANDTTNTITVANATNGQLLTLIVAPASSNLITIADSGNMSLSGAWLGDNNDVITLRGVSTNWVEASASDN